MKDYVNTVDPDETAHGLIWQYVHANSAVVVFGALRFKMQQGSYVPLPTPMYLNSHVNFLASISWETPLVDRDPRKKSYSNFVKNS